MCERRASSGRAEALSLSAMMAGVTGTCCAPSPARAAARTVKGLWDTIHVALPRFTPEDCASYFTAAGMSQSDWILLEYA